MTALGWLFLLLSLTFVWTLTGWCFWRVLTMGEEPPPPVKDFHSA